MPKPDFLSLDIQGYELKALIGAKESVLQDVLGIVLESEFTEIYEGQGLFAEQSIFLRNRGFRLVELFNPQKWFIGPVFGLGFLTVVESLYLKYLIGPETISSLNKDGYQEIEKLTNEKILKLALIAFAFQRYSYFYTLFDYLKTHDVDFYGKLKQKKETLSFVIFFEKVSKEWNRLDLTHTSLTKNFYKKFHKELAVLTISKFKDQSDLADFSVSFRKIIYRFFPFLLKIRLKFLNL